ncbi:unnamed protein product [Chondrus crispus]|uniref:Rhodanese domain-containing protein n=1 Tax=Chondrus crispus TaxID=2769 RepID=R7QF71_CHOCR|nr:unnamed protein product [Chondrus crispus]CDF36086.1 unnamed protein product [Chondrus crispus]|eukprot:XP_005715905.1 unnamed protein product [Chondrus crispus]
MKFAFAPPTLFFGRQLFGRLGYPILSKPQNRTLVEAKLTARERRRSLGQSRKRAHLDVKKNYDTRHDHLVSAVVTIPRYVRDRCCLTSRMARVKVFLERAHISDVGVFRGRVRAGLVSIFPELEQRGFLRVSDGFDMKIGGGAAVHTSTDLKQGLEKCERVGTAIFIEVIPHNTPPPKPPLSPRVRAVAEKARQAMSNHGTMLHMISFYKFTTIENPHVTSEILQKWWSKMGVKGRVYVAREGVNAQLAVPEPVLKDFQDAMNGSWIERGAPLIPSEIVGVFLNTDGIVHQIEQPFEKLHVRPREKVLADGFDEPLDWAKSGREVPPEEWHRTLAEKPHDVVLLDCRNNYESDIGRFEGAETLDTSTFKETWDKLEKRLQHEDRNKKILTYCTGGIRCVKVNAFLEQKMGFNNTGRLQGGVVSYARRLKENGRIHESIFKGVNHVFDGRMGETITEDLLTQCANCGEPCNIQTDCANLACPRAFDDRMFVQCADCATEMRGACSENCRESLVRNAGLLEAPSSKETCTRSQSINDLYADAFSTDESPLLRSIREATIEKFPSRARMLSSHTQACFLRMLIQITNATRVIEIGTFTGYATLAMASALPTSGVLVTCEYDDEVSDVAERFFEASQHDSKIILLRGTAIDTLENLEQLPFDIAFIDADKGGYQAYKDLLLDRNLLRVGGLLLCDNILFRGEVSSMWFNGDEDDSSIHKEMARKRVRNLKNVRRTAKKLHGFNKSVKDDDRLDQVVLPFGDGLTVARRVR